MNKLLLIDVTEQCPEAIELEEVNFLTGERYRKTITGDCKVVLNKKDRVARKPLVKIENL